MTTIYLIRHAEAEGNLYRRIHGHYDSLITENGFRQIAALQARFADVHIDAVYSSNLYRTVTTGRAIWQAKGLEVHTDPRLREIFMGEWEDRPWGEIRHLTPDELTRFNATDPTWRAPIGENLAEVGDRMEEAIREIASRHDGETVAIFSHGTAIRQFTANARKLPPEQWKILGHSDNTAVTKLTFDGVDFSVEYEGDASHLDDSISTLARQSWWRKEGKQSPDVNLWHRPINLSTELELYLKIRCEVWEATHVNGPHFRSAPFYNAAEEDLAKFCWSISVTMQGETPAGILQLDPFRGEKDGIGYITFLHLLPSAREQGLEIQLIGQAVSLFRPMGMDRLRLLCPACDRDSVALYGKYGFVSVGEEQTDGISSVILEKYIGYER